jgi:N-acetylglucosamine-6-sulfatase
MSRCRPAIGLVVAAALVAAAAPAAAEARQTRPNIVIVMSDDQTVESLRVMSRTRELIGARGVEFTRSFVNYALCCPSRATLFTGQYSHNHGVLSNQLPSGGYTRLDRSNWLPGWLQAAGYYTVHVGKFLNGYGRDVPLEVPPGWSEWYGTVDPSTYRFWNYTVNENGALVTYGANNEPGLYSTDFFSRRSADLVTRLAPSDTPFFLSVAYLAPHSGQPAEPDDPQNLATPAVAPRHRDAFASEPFPVTPSFNEADVSDKPRRISTRRLFGPPRIAAIQEGYRQRLESLLAVDEGIALILEALARSGEIDNTIVVFTSDNGFFHGEHRIPTGKLLPYEPSIRVPLLMRGPGIQRGLRLGQLVTNADLAQTVLDAADATPGRTQDGRSLLRLADDPGLWWGRELLTEGGDRNGLTFTGLRNYRYSYVEYATGERELYDLEADPDQLQSRHFDPNYAGVQAALAQRLAAMRACAGRACRAGPRLKLRVRPRRCVDRVLRARLTGSDRGLVDLARFYTRGRGRGADRRAPFGRRLRVRVRPGRRFLLRVRAALEDGRVVTVDRHPRACRR